MITQVESGALTTRGHASNTQGSNVAFHIPGLDTPPMDVDFDALFPQNTQNTYPDGTNFAITLRGVEDNTIGELLLHSSEH